MVRTGYGIVLTIVFCIVSSVRTEAGCTDSPAEMYSALIRYFTNANTDSLRSAVNRWRAECSNIHIDDGILLLYAIRTEGFSSSMIGTMFFTHAFEIERQYARTELYTDIDVKAPGLEAAGQYNEFLRKTASALLPKCSRNTDEYLICLFYSGDFKGFYSLLRDNPDYSGCRLTSLYDYYVRYYRHLGRPEIGLIAGAWIPLGHASRLGIHPNLGYSMGWQQGPVSAGITMAFKFLDAPDDYYVKQAGLFLPTHEFFGGQIGLDIGYELFRIRRHELHVVTGINFDGFDALDMDRSPIEKAVSINTLNINPGFEYRFFHSKNEKTYIGLRIRYNIVDYMKSGQAGSNLSGNTVSTEFVTGYAFRDVKNESLKNLRYYK